MTHTFRRKKTEREANIYKEKREATKAKYKIT
jgi:hypothetical protein